MTQSSQDNSQYVEYTGHIPNTPMRFVWYMARQFWGWGLLAFMVVTIASVSAAATPYLFGLLVDTAQQGDQQKVMMLVGVFIGVSILTSMSWRLSGFFGMKFKFHVERQAHIELFEYLSNHSQAYFNDRFAGTLASKVSNGADGAEHLLENIQWNYYSMVLSYLISMGYVFWVNVWLGMFFLFATIILFLINCFFVKRLLPLVVKYQQTSSRFRGFIIDVLTNITAVKSYVRAKDEKRTLAKIAKTRMSEGYSEWRYGEYILILNEVIVACIQIVLFASTTYLWVSGHITVGVLVMLFTVFYRVQSDLVFIGQNIRSFIRQYGMIEEGLSEILVGQELVNAPNAKKLKTTEGKVVFNEVAFAYVEGAVFDDFSISIEGGESVGLVGVSGAGKSTLVSLLLRKHDINGGFITIDGQDIANVTQDSLREAIAVVPQEPVLFHRSIHENIAYGKRGATRDDVIQAAKKAEAHDFIASLPEGYDTLVGERGVKLSGGQKQRVAIARAMLKDAPILVLDEATSALDSESEVAIQKALHKLMEDKTVIAVAHRLSTLREMDRIIVMDNGKIVEDGNHDELRKQGGQYARLWKHQAGGFLQE